MMAKRRCFGGCGRVLYWSARSRAWLCARCDRRWHASQDTRWLEAAP